MNVLELIERTRDHIGEVATADFQPEQWTDGRLLRDLNAASDNLWAELVKMDENWGLRRSSLSDLGATVTTDRGSLLKITLGMDVYHIKRIEDNQGGGRASPWQPGELHELDQRDPRDDTSIPEGRKWILGDNRTIYVTNPNYGVDLDNVDVWHLQKYPHMVVFNATSPDADNDGRSTLLRVAIHDDVKQTKKDEPYGQLSPHGGYYRQSYVECIDNGKQDPQGRVLLVTGYAEDTYPFYQFTVDDHAVPGQGATWSVAPQYPEDQQELLSLMAAQKALGKSGDVAARPVIEAEVSKKLMEFKHVMERRQIAEPRSVRLIEDRP